MENLENTKEKTKSLRQLKGCFFGRSIARSDICDFCFHSDVCPVSDSDKKMFFSSNGDYEKYLEKNKKKKSNK